MDYEVSDLSHFQKPFHVVLQHVMLCDDVIFCYPAYRRTWLCYGLDDRVSIPGRGNCEIFLFTTTSRPALRPTQSPTRWVPGLLPHAVKRLGSEADHSPPCSAEVKNAWSYTSTHDVMLN